MRKKQSIVIRKRGIKRHSKVKHNSLKLFGINAAGINSKIKSFDHVISRLKPHIWMIEETKLKPHEKIRGGCLDHFQVYYLSRQNMQGGGIAIGIDKMLESTMLNSGNDETEIMSVLVVIENISIRIIVAYGVQENASKEKKDRFWEFLEEEVFQAEKENQGVIIQMDGNLHAGKELIKNDPNIQNQNGRLFMQFLQRNSGLVVVNSLNICKGLITRQRRVNTKIERAVLDFFIVNDRLAPFLKSMLVDEEKEFCVNNFSQAKKNKRVIESDHNGLILELSLQFSHKKPDREVMFNLKNRECQEHFRNETNMNKEIFECFENNWPLEVQSKKWLKTFNSILHKCFRKVRICKRKNINSNSEKYLMEERIKLKKEGSSEKISDEIKQKIEIRIAQIEEEIGEKIVEDYHNEILETIEGLGGDDTSLNGAGRTKLWKLMKQKFPKTETVIPVGKKDRDGNVITNHIGLKHLYLQTYVNRLRNRPIREDFEELKQLKQLLFNLRRELCKTRTTEPWNMSDLDAAIKDLKRNKARDPNGWLNDIFMQEIAGKNLKISMLKMFNRIKTEDFIPNFMRKAEVTTIYKGKGSKSDLKNDRGVFIVSVFRNLLMKMIYKDIYETLDKSMSDSQIGSRRNKNIRNHIWVLNSIICDVLSSKTKKSIDVQIYDYKECFDSLWLEECMNDMYRGGLTNENFNLLYSTNNLVKVAIRTPVGKTESKDIHRAVIQGDVFGSLLCSKQVDMIAKECIEEQKYLYKYKNEVLIPPLTMVDDVLCISECGFKTAMINSYLNCKTNTKKLQFGINKCKKMHIGKEHQEYKCQPLFVDSWREIEKKNEKDGDIEINDEYIGEEVVEDISEEKYLGDIISSDGRNIKNIKARISKGKGIIKKIMNILNSIPFGKLYFQIAILLRNALFVSSLLCNSEAWFNLTKAELNLIETVDLELLRKILKAPQSTPKESLFMELGVLPLRYIILQRRMNFLFYIIRQKNDSMIGKVFQTQMEHKTSKDWVTMVLKDIKELEINVNFVDIKHMSKNEWSRIITKSIKEKAFRKLEEDKSNHSKVMNIKYKALEMQSYFLPNKLECTREDIELIFRLRTKMTKVKMNSKNKFDTHECTICHKEEETQFHVYTCEEIWKIRGDNRENYTSYEKILDGKRKEKIQIAKVFRENFKIIERAKS